MSNRIESLALVVLGLPVLAFGLAAATAHADTIYVCWDVSGDYLTIQAGIDAAQDGDEVVVCDGTYTGVGNKDLDFGGKLITVRSENGPESCIIDCEEDGRGFYLHSGETEVAVIAGFTITRARVIGNNGGGIRCSFSSPTITDCAITGNHVWSASGAGVSCSYSDALISHCTITDNTGGGGIYCGPGDVMISNCTIARNNGGEGAGIQCRSGYTTVINCSIEANTASFGGGGIHCDGGHLDATNCSILGNTAGQGGGGVRYHDSSGTIAHSVIVGNAADDGAGIHTFESTVTIHDCSITANTVRYYGGGIYFERQSYGTIGDCTIMGNTATAYGGGGLCVWGSHAEVTRCTIAGNSAPSFGGGICCGYSSGTIVGCTIADNSITDSHGRGGAILCLQSSPTIANCSIAGNEAIGYESDGGAVACRDSSNPTIANCIITGNTAEGNGGGVCCRDESSPTIVNCTITGNTAQGGGGGVMSYDSSNPTIANCVLWGDSAAQGPEIAVVWHSGLTVSYTDVQGGEGGAYVADGCTLNWADGNIDGDPLFVDPDGPDDDPNTWEDNDYHLSAGSPCIDAGDNEAVPEGVTTDLDGNPRFIDDPDTEDTGNGEPPIVDMGSYEYQIPGDLNGDGCVDHSDLGMLLGDWNCTGGGCPGDCDGDGDTDHADLGILLAHWGEGCP